MTPAAIETREPDFLWQGTRPVFRCRFCGDHFERVENLEAVLKHEREAHGEKNVAAIRTSRILGEDGNPLQVEEE